MESTQVINPISGLIDYKLRPYQKKTIDFLDGTNSSLIINKSRQMGVSTMMGKYMDYLSVMKGQSLLYVSHNIQSARSMVNHNPNIKVGTYHDLFIGHRYDLVYLDEFNFCKNIDEFISQIAPSTSRLVISGVFDSKTINKSLSSMQMINWYANEYFDDETLNSYKSMLGSKFDKEFILSGI